MSNNRAVTHDSLSQTKMALRRWITTQIRETLPEQRAEWSQKIIRHLMEHSEWLPDAGVVAIFGGLKQEVDVMPLFAWLQERNCKMALFQTESETETDAGSGIMRPWLVRSFAETRHGQYGVLEPIPEPGSERELHLSDLSVVLTPGLAFDRESGQRMGRGKGYYDRVFGSAEFRGIKIGVAFELQLINAVPIESHDQPMHHIVTETGWRTFVSPSESDRKGSR